jgi:threonine dehydratase
MAPGIEEKETVVNGHSNGRANICRTPSLTSFSLTEYSANPSPPREAKDKAERIVPLDFLLPSGYPDVRL